MAKLLCLKSCSFFHFLLAPTVFIRPNPNILKSTWHLTDKPYNLHALQSVMSQIPGSIELSAYIGPIDIKGDSFLTFDKSLSEKMRQFYCLM